VIRVTLRVLVAGLASCLIAADTAGLSGGLSGPLALLGLGAVALVLLVLDDSGIELGAQLSNDSELLDCGQVREWFACGSAAERHHAQEQRGHGVAQRGVEKRRGSGALQMRVVEALGLLLVQLMLIREVAGVEPATLRS